MLVEGSDQLGDTAAQHGLLPATGLVPPSLTKRIVNHTRPNDVTVRYAANWTVTQLREPTQRVADRTEALMGGALAT